MVKGGQTMPSSAAVSRAKGENACVACGSTVEPTEEYGLDIAGREVTFVATRCPSCANEYVNAPEILRPDKELMEAYRPSASALGSFRRVLTLTSRDRELRHRVGDKVAGTLLWYLLEEDMADVVFLAHLSVTEEPVMAFKKKDLFEAWQIRMGAGRAITTGGGLRANLATLTELLGFDPSEIRQVRFLGDEMEFVSGRGVTRKVPQGNIAGLVNANCLQCYDFSVKFSDISVGHIGGGR